MPCSRGSRGCPMLGPESVGEGEERTCAVTIAVPEATASAVRERARVEEAAEAVEKRGDEGAAGCVEGDC